MSIFRIISFSVNQFLNVIVKLPWKELVQWSFTPDCRTKIVFYFILEQIRWIIFRILTILTFHSQFNMHSVISHFKTILATLMPFDVIASPMSR